MGPPMFHPILVTTVGLAASLQGKASTGRLHRVLVTNNNAAARYFLLFDTAGALPADGAVPIVGLNVAAMSKPPAFDFGPEGYQFTNGIWCCNSTTLATKTLAGADAFIHMQIS